jgi:choline kinase
MLPVLLAAGLGRRLGGLPKALFPLAEVPLMLRTAHALRAAGFDRMLVVTGHGRDEVQEYWEGLEQPPLAVEWLHNPHYADRNNFYTVALACDHPTDEPLLVINSDIVFVPEVVAGLIDCDDDLVIVIDDTDTDDEAMGVKIFDGRAVALGKHLPSNETAGEFIGVSIIGSSAKAMYLAVNDEVVAAGDHTLYYEDIFGRLAAEHPLGVAVVQAAHWAEIDAPEDVPRALDVARLQQAAVPAFQPNA